MPRLVLRWGFVVALLVLVCTGGASAEDDEGRTPVVGEPGPELSATTWLNTSDESTPPETDGHVVLVELWGTWCGPCVRSMPRVQGLWDRYRDRGLVVVGITREAEADVRSFVDDKGYTFPIGCDPTQACVRRYKPRGWPSTYVIDKSGTLTYAGDPYGAEAAVESALGLESGPGPVLVQTLDAWAKPDEAARRSTLERLIEKAPCAFDAGAWAQELVGAPSEEPPAGQLDAGPLLEQLAKTWGAADPAKRSQILEKLAGGTAPFDLRSWAVERYAKAFPLKKDEVQGWLASKQYARVLDALLDRRPSSSVVKAAAKDEGLAAYAGKLVDDWRTLARKALMAHHYLLGEMRYDPEKNDEFWRDLSVSGMSTSADRKQIVGVLIAGERVNQDNASSFADRKLLLWSLGRELAAGETPRLPACEKEASKERKRIEAELERTYKKK
ncbi:MAG: TlpA family protein disulfide reductase [Planctomycetes bacterium]|nr:TlpA family protein disulfide reductase [Planctomycetota bacterium]MCB9824345.1 TlpA family protein disulfide reductase [Planctomycetota bacterium]MCB9828568.1 TlpA family protein disulfide reductase [Planctomycetota bacterium]MCB9900342.1 TlpA family protein disulfide reductase [Planctomycetota bacterium]